MATFSAEVTNSANRREHCLVDAGQLESIGCALGQQVRVSKSQDQFALYRWRGRGNDLQHVRKTAEGRERLGASGEFDAIVDSQITDLIHDDGQAEKLGEFVERLTDDGVHTAMVVIAPHGGLIEEYTDHQAERGLVRSGSHSHSPSD